MDEHYLVHLTSVFLFSTLLPLCLLGSEFKFQSAAQPSNDLTGDHLLSPKEVDALENITSSLEFRQFLRVNPTICVGGQFEYITIGCKNYTSDDPEMHVTKLFMENARLTGVISEDVGNLTFLEVLDMSSNQIRGSIPDKLGDLENLVTLDLSQNQLTGKIPLTLGKLKNLKTLFLENNQLSDVIPPQLGDLHALQILDLSDNELTGRLPPELGKLSNLQQLDLVANRLSGKLPEEYKNLKGMRYFRVSGNNLSGSIPTYFGDWIDLTALNLLGNNFEGELPQAIFNMKNLEYLVVTNLNNSGIAFPESANLENIYTLILRNCNINGEIPPYIAHWSTLKNLDLSFNNLIGELPDDFKKMSLRRLFLTRNMINGNFPNWINKTTVQVLGDLSYNNFTFDDTKLPVEVLYNSSSGTNPAETTKINIEPRNRTFPQLFMDEHCHSKKSKYHSLFINAGGDHITIGRNHYEADNSTLNFYISPAHNWAYSCNGDFYGTTSNSSHFIRNITCGVSAIDAPLYSTARLCPQSLTYYGFCLLKGTYTVKLQFFESIFSEAEDYTRSGKRVFDIYIQGKLEQKDFDTKEKTGYPNRTGTEKYFTVDVDDHLLEIELFWAGKGSIDEPVSLQGPLVSAISVTPNFKVGGPSKRQIVGIVFAAVLTPVLLLALIWRMGWLGDRELRVNTVALDGKDYTIKQVKDATGNFSQRNVIGKGRFGIVYKAELSGLTVAVKKISPQSKQVIDQIRTEMYTLTAALKDDNNIVKLWALHSKRNLHFIIYEFMENGSLQKALFDSNSTVELSWPTRVAICLGIAKALQSMHGHSHPIIHRNIKPSNVLLDREFNAKVSDLGLAKIYDEENPYKFIQEVETRAYMAPEYIRMEAITEKIDVYSFGILVLEIVSRETNVRKKGNEETDSLLEKAFICHSKETLYEMVDKNMNDVVMEQATKILELAMQCVHQAASLRPTMSHVVSMLQEISNVNTPTDIA